MLETGQKCLIFISKGHFLLKKIIQGQKGQWRPTKANKGQQSPKLQISYVIITIQCKIINKCQYDTKEMCFLKIWNFHFHYINFLNLHFVEYVKFSKHFQWNNGTGSFIWFYITWKKCKIIHKFPPMEILLNIWWKSLPRNSRYCPNHQNEVTSCFPKMVIKMKKKYFLYWIIKI